MLQFDIGVGGAGKGREFTPPHQTPRAARPFSRKESQMTPYWITFTDGYSGCCEGVSEHDAVKIAEMITGKKVRVDDPEVRETVPGH